jgi:hypothetical protein
MSNVLAERRRSPGAGFAKQVPRTGQDGRSSVMPERLSMELV